MAKLGPYSYPDIRFGDAVEIAGRILSKFKGTVGVKGLAWELGMAEGSGTLFAKVAALRDFGLVEGRGELRISPLAQRILHPASPEEGREARAEAFQRVELLRQLYHRFDGEIPDDMSVLIGLDEITRAPRDEIVRRAPLIQKHLTDAVRVLGRIQLSDKPIEPSGKAQNIHPTPGVASPVITFPAAGAAAEGDCLVVAAGDLRFAAPLTVEYIDVALKLLGSVKTALQAREGPAEEPVQPRGSAGAGEVEPTVPRLSSQ